jgi:hypothetical protein
MWYPDVKNSKEEEDHWIGLSDLERERFERHANFLIDQGTMREGLGAMATAAIRPALGRTGSGRPARPEIGWPEEAG